MVLPSSLTFQRKQIAHREILRPDRPILRHAIRTRRFELPPNVYGLRRFQVEGVHWLRSRRLALLADEMGLGKSAQVLRALQAGGRTIVVCPKSLRLLWRNQIAQWRPDLRARIAKGADDLAPKRGEVVIVNYEALPEPVSRRILVRADLGDVELVFDEAHYLKNPEANRTESARALVRQVGRVWMLTATPLLSTPEDLWGLLETANLHRQAFGSRSEFVEMFGGRRRRGGYEWTATDYTIPRAALAKVMLRRRREDVLPELPRKEYTEIPVELDATLDEADRAWKLLGATTLPRFEDLSAAMAELARAKIPAMLEAVKRYEDERLPLIVFAAHVDPIAALDRREGWAIVTGATKERDDDRAIARFQAGELRGIGITIQKGGVGHNLSHGCHELFVSLYWNPGINKQAEDRPVRFGQKAPRVHVVQLVADHPLDRRIFEVLSGKESMNAGVLG